ncbi:MAG: hypothetical protein JRF41_10275 [Deltaproteobacteria bacterium]|nr:hypothetical protein [Deltaproteobacteria bacterium]
MKKYSLIWVIVLFMFFGCATYQTPWTATPKSASVSNKFFKATITPGSYDHEKATKQMNTLPSIGTKAFSLKMTKPTAVLFTRASCIR